MTSILKPSILLKSLRICFLFFVSIPFQLQAQDSLATIYFYRVDKFAGSFVGYDLKHGEKVIGRIKAGSVVAYRSKPGDQVFKATTESESSILLILEAGKVYFVECGISVGALVGKPTFREASSSAGIKQIAFIDPHLANSIPTDKSGFIQEADTARALNNLFQRKRKGGATRAIVFATLGVAAIIRSVTYHPTVTYNGGYGNQTFDVGSSDKTGVYLSAGFCAVMIVTGGTQANNYSSEKRDKVIDDFRKGVPLPEKIKSKLKRKDFE